MEPSCRQCESKVDFARKKYVIKEWLSWGGCPCRGLFCDEKCMKKWLESRCASCYDGGEDLVKSTANSLLYCSTPIYEKDPSCLDRHLGFTERCHLCSRIIREEEGLNFCTECAKKWKKTQRKMSKSLFEDFKTLRHNNESCSSGCDCATQWLNWGIQDITSKLLNKKEH